MIYKNNGKTIKITYNEIATMVNKGEQAIKKMKTENPQQLELLTLGAICKKYNIGINDLIEIQKSES